MQALPFDGRYIDGIFVVILTADTTILDLDNMVSHGRDQCVMGDDDDCDILPAAGILQQFQDLLTGLIVKSAGGLVAQ